MNSPEVTLLSLLREGDMIRFVLQPGDAGKIRISLEGAHGSTSDGLLSSRMEVAVKALWHQGFRFDDTEKVAGPKKRTSRKSLQKVLIRPRAFEIILPEGKLGFTSDSTTDDVPLALSIPDFMPFLQPTMFPSFHDLILDLKEVGHLEVEFTHQTVSLAQTRILGQALEYFRSLEAAAWIQQEPPAPRQAFLALWLMHREGYAMRVRATINAGCSPAALEMIGRDLFGCECEVVQERHSVRRTAGLDLVDSYPRGWNFPGILPEPSDLERVDAAQMHNPDLTNLPRTGLQIGVADGKVVRLPKESRNQHVHITGATGTGKSTLVARMICNDVLQGEAVTVIDPHGGLAEQVLEFIPDSRRDQLTIIDPYHDGLPPGMNILDMGDSPRPEWRARFVIGELLRFFESVWDMRQVGGPMFEMYFRNALLLMTDQGVRERSNLTLLHFAQLLSDKDFRHHQLEVCRNSDVKQFWTGIAEKAGGDASLANIVPYIVSKMEILTQSSFIRQLIGSPKDTLRIREKMDTKQILICNLSKGALGITESRLLGTLLLAQIFAAGLERGLLPKKKRNPVNIYVDEFQNFVSDNMASMLSEARKFGLRLTLANQTLGQLTANTGNQNLLETVLGNVGNLIFFRLGVPDAERLKLFLEPFTRQEMQELPNYHAFARLLTAEGPLKPLIMKTLPV